MGVLAGYLILHFRMVNRVWQAGKQAVSGTTSIFTLVNLFGFSWTVCSVNTTQESETPVIHGFRLLHHEKLRFLGLNLFPP